MGLISGAIKLIVGIVALLVFIALIGGAIFVYRARRVKSGQVNEIEHGGLPPTLSHNPPVGIQKPHPVHGAVPAGDPYGQYFHNGKP